MLTTDTGPVTKGSETEKAIEDAKRQLEELRNSTYGIPGNITGLQNVGKIGADGQLIMMPPKMVRKTVDTMIKSVIGDNGDVEDDGGILEGGGVVINNNSSESDIPIVSASDLEEEDFASGRAIKLARRAQLPLGHDMELPFYHNASGAIRGEWHRLYDLPPYKLTNTTKDLEKNITGTHGKLVIRIEESRPRDVQEVQVRINIETGGGHNNHDLMMDGIHFVKSGDMVLTTNSRECV